MAITTMDTLVAALPGQVLPFYKASATSKAGGTFHSLWAVAGTPGAGSAPSSGAGQTCTSATTGALSFTNPSGANLSYIARAVTSCATVGALIIYDRLVTTSGLNGTLTTAQTINSVSLPRYTTGTGVTAWLEWYSATGSTASNLTFTYTNDAGTTAQTAPTLAVQQTPVVGQMQPIPLNGKDGIRVAESATLSASTGTAGNFGITLMRRLITVPMPLANSAVIFDAFAAGMQQVQDSACLSFMVWCSATNTGILHGELTIAQG